MVFDRYAGFTSLPGPDGKKRRPFRVDEEGNIIYRDEEARDVSPIGTPRSQARARAGVRDWAELDGKAQGRLAELTVKGTDPLVPDTSTSVLQGACQLVTPSGRYRADPGTIALFQPDFAAKLSTGIKVLNNQGIAPVITDGYRTQEMQYARRRGPKKYGAAKDISAHQVGLAADLGVNSNTGHNAAILRAMTSAGLVNGAHFTPSDPVHYVERNAVRSQNRTAAKSCAATYASKKR